MTISCLTKTTLQRQSEKGPEVTTNYHRTARGQNPSGEMMSGGLPRTTSEDRKQIGVAEVVICSEEGTTSEEQESDLDEIGDEEDGRPFIGYTHNGDREYRDDDSTVAFSDIVISSDESQDPFLKELAAEKQTDMKNNHSLGANDGTAVNAVRLTRLLPVSVRAQKPRQEYLYSVHEICAQTLAAKRKDLMQLTHQELHDRLKKRLRPYMRTSLNQLPQPRQRKRPICVFLNHFGTRRSTRPQSSAAKKLKVSLSLKESATVAKKLPLNFQHTDSTFTVSSLTKQALVSDGPSPCVLPKLLTDTDPWASDLADGTADTANTILHQVAASNGAAANEDIDSADTRAGTEVTQHLQRVAWKARKSTHRITSKSSKATVKAIGKTKRKMVASKKAEAARAKALKKLALQAAHEKAKRDAFKDMAAMRIVNISEIVKDTNTSSSLKEMKASEHVSGKTTGRDDSATTQSSIVDITADESTCGPANKPTADFPREQESLHEPLPLFEVFREDPFEHLVSDHEVFHMLAHDEAWTFEVAGSHSKAAPVKRRICVKVSPQGRVFKQVIRGDVPQEKKRYHSVSFASDLSWDNLNHLSSRSLRVSPETVVLSPTPSEGHQPLSPQYDQ